jgi:hypothetical protein
MRQGLERIFRHVNIRSLWDPKTAKFEPPKRAMVSQINAAVAKKQLSFSNFRKSKNVS